MYLHCWRNCVLVLSVCSMASVIKRRLCAFNLLYLSVFLQISASGLSSLQVDKYALSGVCRPITNIRSVCQLVGKFGKQTNRDRPLRYLCFPDCPSIWPRCVRLVIFCGISVLCNFIFDSLCNELFCVPCQFSILCSFCQNYDPSVLFRGLTDAWDVWSMITGYEPSSSLIISSLPADSVACSWGVLHSKVMLQIAR